MRATTGTRPLRNTQELRPVERPARSGSNAKIDNPIETIALTQKWLCFFEYPKAPTQGNI